MAVALSAHDQTGINVGTPTSPNTSYSGLTVNAGDTDLIVFVTFGGSVMPTAGSVAVVWDNGGTNQTMTAVATPINTTDNAGQVGMFYLANPTSGKKTVKISWTGGTVTDLWISACSFSGGGASSGATTARGTVPTNAETISVTSPGTSVAVSSFTNNQTALATPASSGTSIWNNSTGTTAQGYGIDRTGAGGATTMTPGGTGVADVWAAMGVSIDVSPRPVGRWAG